jgi:hypothetical protein
MSENRKRWWEKVNIDGEKWPGTESARACLLRRGNAESAMPSLFLIDFLFGRLKNMVGQCTQT